MKKTNSFMFLDDDLNRQLIALLKKSKVKHYVDKDGTVYYPLENEETVENDFICLIRNKVFPSWQVLTCPPEWIEIYKKHMRHQGIPFQEELSNGELWFLLPRKYQPHRWKLSRRMKGERMAV